MATEDEIPVVDFQAVLDAENLTECPRTQEIHRAFSRVGFVFLTNHGINMDLVSRAFHAGHKFFKLPVEVKRKYIHCTGGENDTGNNGYSEMEQEHVNPDSPGDLKEAFNIADVSSELFPDAEFPEFRQVMVELYKSAIACGKKILEVMGHALQLEDPMYFVDRHKFCESSNNYTTGRVLFYPPLPTSTVIKPGQLRCGEHVDYGSITLLFQDPSGGLQVKKCGGGYIDVPYLEGAVLVNLGALMQRWTSDKYLATPHRVLLPSDALRDRARQSIAVFIHPDHKVLIECLDKSNKYPPVLAYEDTNQRLTHSYNY